MSTAIARCVHVLGEPAMGESLGDARLEFLVKTTISHIIPDVGRSSLHECGDSVQKLKNV